MTIRWCCDVEGTTRARWFKANGYINWTEHFLQWMRLFQQSLLLSFSPLSVPFVLYLPRIHCFTSSSYQFARARIRTNKQSQIHGTCLRWSNVTASSWMVLQWTGISDPYPTSLRTMPRRGSYLTLYASSGECLFDFLSRKSSWNRAHQFVENTSIVEICNLDTEFLKYQV